MSSAYLTIEFLNTSSEEDFIEQLGDIYEHSPWIISEATCQRPFTGKQALQACFESTIYGASAEKQFQLIKAHPDLAAKMDELATLTDFSQAEQERAGFSALPKETFEALRSTLISYREKFGHPFILCVSDHSAADTLPILQQRINASANAEVIACLSQIARIGWHRLDSKVSS